MRSRVLLIIALVIAGCATTSPAMRPLAVAIGDYDGRSCPITIDHESYPDQRVAVEELQSRLAGVDRRREVHITGIGNTPYRCIGGVIFALQRLGFHRIGFISEPAPTTSANPNGR